MKLHMNRRQCKGFLLEAFSTRFDAMFFISQAPKVAHFVHVTVIPHRLYLQGTSRTKTEKIVIASLTIKVKRHIHSRE